MDTENDAMFERSHLLQTIILGIYVSFRGVYPPFSTFSFQETQQKFFLRNFEFVTEDVNSDDPEAAERFQELVAAYNSIMGHLD